MGGKKKQVALFMPICVFVWKARKNRKGIKFFLLYRNVVSYKVKDNRTAMGVHVLD